MEESGELDVDSELDSWCLLAIFLPVIQRHLDDFRRSWNSHGLSSVRGFRRPNQLWIRGLHDLREQQILLNAERANRGEEPHQFTELNQVLIFFQLSGKLAD